MCPPTIERCSASTCIDSGDASLLPISTTDLDGPPRIQNGILGMGVDEFPIAGFPGTSGDLELFTWIDSGGDRLASTMTATVGEVPGVELDSPGQVFTGTPPLLPGQIHVSGLSPAPVPELSALHLDPLAAFVVAGNPAAVPFTVAGPPQNGLLVVFQIHPGLVGLTLRLQGAAIAALAENGSFALTAAHDVQLQ